MIARPFPGLGAGLLLGPPLRAGLPLPPGSILTHLARTALTQAYRALELRAGDEVLVPAFHCGVEADAARHAGASVRYYPVPASLAIDPDVIARRMGARTRAVIAVHYFGIPQSLAEVAELCRERGAALVEDCAHVAACRPSAARGPGSWGDAAVYSMPKFYPVPDGGILALRDGWPKAAASIALRPPPRGALARRTARLLLDHRREGKVPARAERPVAERATVEPEPAKPVKPTRYDPASSAYDPNVSDAAASCWTRRILLRVDFEEVARMRRQNYNYLVHAVTQIGGVALVARAFPESEVPMVLPVRVRDASGVADRMRARGVGAYRLGARLPLDSDAADLGEARGLRDTLLGLPIHQNLRPPQLDAVAEALARSTS